MKPFKIRISESISHHLSSREQADSLYLLIKKCSEEVIIDFDRVGFVSRSFADQFYKQFLKLNKQLLITVVNCNQEVCDIINAVSRTQSGYKKDRMTFKMRSFVSKAELKNYLQSID
jgi:anti-anti-sigma regulatory factor